MLHGLQRECRSPTATFMMPTQTRNFQSQRIVGRRMTARKASVHSTVMLASCSGHAPQRKAGLFFNLALEACRICIGRGHGAHGTSAEAHHACDDVIRLQHWCDPKLDEREAIATDRRACREWRPVEQAVLAHAHAKLGCSALRKLEASSCRTLGSWQG